MRDFKVNCAFHISTAINCLKIIGQNPLDSEVIAVQKNNLNDCFDNLLAELNKQDDSLTYWKEKLASELKTPIATIKLNWVFLALINFAKDIDIVPKEIFCSSAGLSNLSFGNDLYAFFNSISQVQRCAIIVECGAENGVIPPPYDDFYFGYNKQLVSGDFSGYNPLFCKICLDKLMTYNQEILKGLSFFHQSLIYYVSHKQLFPIN